MRDFPIVDLDFIQSLIPQKKPFVMVEHFLNYSDKNITSSLEIREENILVENQHLTASGLIEHMAQTVALHTGYNYYLQNKTAPTGYIGAIKSVEIASLPRIGTIIQTTAHILQEFMGVTLVDIHAEINGKVIAKAQMKTVIQTV
ncbi:MAG: hypothetical protein Q4B43_06195 [Bacteroidota bacterium]|nr:hypothetical protein [Bacteroidota bacterium]